MKGSEIVFSPSEFVGVVNQTLDYAYPVVIIEGELANVKISRDKWVYFNIKDDTASVKCFGTVFMLPGPIEEGMMVRIVSTPRLHPLYNFSLNIQSIMPIGEGSIKRASDLLFQKLSKEGLFDETRKRKVPYAPESIALITSKQSAAYGDFNKILNSRWTGIKIYHVDIQVQGDQAITDIAEAINVVNQLANPPEVIVLTRGGGSIDDLAAFSSEQVVRCIAGSRIPTIVAIGHEMDVSLAELAADKRASTPSNAAEIIVPDKNDVIKHLKANIKSIAEYIDNALASCNRTIDDKNQLLSRIIKQTFTLAEQSFIRQRQLLTALNPGSVLAKGYAIVRYNSKVVKSIKQLGINDKIEITFEDGKSNATINKVEYSNDKK